MFNLISVLGWISLAGGLIYYSLHSNDKENIENIVVQTQTIIIAAVALIVSGYVIKIFNRKIGPGSHNRCRKCGKKIDKTEMFCFDHRREAIWQAQEKYRLEGTGKFNRTDKKRG